MEDRGLYTRTGKMNTGTRVFLDPALTSPAENGVYETPNGYLTIKNGIVVSESLINQ